MPLPFWDAGAVVGRNIDCLLPDVSVQDRLPSRWDWEVIYMAGRRVPGLCEVEFKREHRIDKRAANGVDYQSITSLGYNGADVQIKIRMWTPQQWIDFQAITVPSIQPRPGKPNARPKAVKTEHPALAVWGTKSLFVTHVGGPKPTNIPQAREILITCSDVAPQVQVGTATQKGGGVSSEPNKFTGQPAKPSAPPPSASINTPTPGQ